VAFLLFCTLRWWSTAKKKKLQKKHRGIEENFLLTVFFSACGCFKKISSLCLSLSVSNRKQILTFQLTPHPNQRKKFHFTHWLALEPMGFGLHDAVQKRLWISSTFSDSGRWWGFAILSFRWDRDIEKKRCVYIFQKFNLWIPDRRIPGEAQKVHTLSFFFLSRVFVLEVSYLYGEPV